MLLADSVHLRGWRAELALHYERRGARTVLERRRHDGPLVVQKPLYPEGEGVCHTILIHPPGGLAGGDELEACATLGVNTHVLLTTPAAGKWYRSLGPWARQRIAMTANDAACAEWLPQETILFDGARAHIETDVQLAPHASFIGWDILCLGRKGSGERYASGACRLRTRVRRGNKTLWLERGNIEAGGLLARSPVGLNGHTVFATLVATLNMERGLLDACRAVRTQDGTTGITCPPQLMIARYLGDSSEAAREYFQRLWSLIRPAVAGCAAQTPRIWNT
ncbi:MAG: urease accessory protein UreD [Pseudomonadota bacterium]